MITIFSIPKPFNEKYTNIQLNAIESWIKECPNCEIILAGDEKGTEEVCKKYKLKHLPKIKRNEFGTPMLDSLLYEVTKMAKYDILAFINADIILVGDLEKVIKKISDEFPSFLAVAQRYDSHIKNRITDKPDWRQRALKHKGLLRGERKKRWGVASLTAGGMDLFIWRKGLYDSVPPFAIGRLYYDGWLVYQAFIKKIPIIDITKALAIIHQPHPILNWENEKIKQEKNKNRELCIDKKHIRDASYTFINEEIKPILGITIFSFPRPFLGEYKIIQRNAIKSWKKCCPNSEIILLGDEEGVSKICKEFGFEQIKKVKRNQYGTPYVDDIFNKGQKFAKYGVVCYINTDVIMMGDLEEIVWEARNKFSEFLLVGTRHDMKIEKELEFDENWQEKLREMLQEKGKLHHTGGVDYFVFSHNLFPPLMIPTFLLGRMEWDGWFVWNALERGKPVVDITPVMTVIHQTHTKIEDIFDPERLREEKQINKELCLGTKPIHKSTYIFTPGGIIERKD